MDISEDQELARAAIDYMAMKYKIKQKRDGLHLSSLIYCLTKAQMDMKNGVEPTDEEVLLFALGFGLQDVLTPPGADTPLFELEGITYSPDFVMKLGSSHNAEIKTTRQSSKKADKFEFPDTWIEYMKAGCFITQQNSYNLIVLYMMGNYSPPFPQIRGFRFQFDFDELCDQWEYILARKEVLLKHVEAGSLVPPFVHCKEWECKGCRNKLVCDTIVLSKGGSTA